MIKFIYLILYIIILFILLFIIYNNYYIIEKYVNITNFGTFIDCPPCNDGYQLFGCKGLSEGTCEPCQPGTAGKGGTCDIDCTGNEYSSRGSSSCSICNTDGYKVNSDNTSCEPCPARTAGKGGTCTRCGDGKQPNGSKTACVPCPAGKAGTGGTCTRCAAYGKQPNRSKTACESCPSQGCDNCEYGIHTDERRCYKDSRCNDWRNKIDSNYYRLGHERIIWKYNEYC